MVMRRVALVAIVLLSVLAIGARETFANILPPPGTPFPAICTTQTPYYTLAPCGLATPGPRALILPVKSLSVGGGVPGPENTIAFPVTINSSLVCFTLDEPITAFTMGAPKGASVLYQIAPTPETPSLGSLQQVNVDPATGAASLRLEVYKDAISPSGVNVKAVWPQEGIDRVAVAIPPTPATATPTSTPHVAVTPSGPPPSPPAAPVAQPTFTPAPSPTATSTATATAPASATPTATSPGPAAVATGTGTPSGTATPEATPDARPFFVQTCLSPSVIRAARGQSVGATFYALTKPGATCTASVRYLPGGAPGSANFNGSSQTALADGLAIFPLNLVETSQTGGIATANCTLSGQRITSSTAFAIVPPATPVPISTTTP
jgi:hypothetical protein